MSMYIISFGEEMISKVLDKMVSLMSDGQVKTLRNKLLPIEIPKCMEFSIYLKQS